MSVELNAEQCERVDEIYDAVWEMCKVFTESPDLPASIDYLGPIAEDVAELLVSHGFKVRFPAVIYDADADKEYVSEYYE